MPLLSSNLARGLLDLATNRPASPFEAAKRWAHAYAQYAADALSPVAAPPAPLTLNESVLAVALTAVWATSVLASQTAQQISQALAAFWFAPPVVFGAGVVTSVLGTSALAQALQAVWFVNQAGNLSADAATRSIAAAIDAFTHTVIVTTPGGPPIVGPIT